MLKPQLQAGAGIAKGGRFQRGERGGGQGVRGMGALRSDAGEEPVEVGPRVEAAPQAAADEAVSGKESGIPTPRDSLVYPRPALTPV